MARHSALDHQEIALYQKLINASSINIETLEYFAHIVDQHRPNSILELGSGISTLFWTRNCPQAQIVSLEHDAHYCQQSQILIKSSQHPHAQVLYAPLILSRGPARYHVTYPLKILTKAKLASKKFDLVFIDGPPGMIFGREGSLYSLLPYITEQTLCVLDDAERIYEQEAISHWQNHLGLSQLKIVSVGSKKLASFHVCSQKVSLHAPVNTLQPALSLWQQERKRLARQWLKARLPKSMARRLQDHKAPS